MGNINYKVFYTPSNIYIPYDDISKLKLRKNNAVYYGENLGPSIYSSASGLIRGTSKVQFDEKAENALVIENDYRDKTFKLLCGKEKFDFYKRKEANEIFDSFNIDGKFNGKKYLMIDLLIKNNAIENKYISMEYHYELLETIDALLTIFSLDNAYIAVNDKLVSEALERYSGIYPNIKFVSRVVSNNYAVVYNGYNLLRIYNALKFNKYLSEKYITIVSNKETTIVKTKVNILISELLTSLNISYSSISIIKYDNTIINNYNGILTDNIKTIKVV